MSKADVRRWTDIALYVMTKMRQDKAVTLAILGKIYSILDAEFSDMMNMSWRKRNDQYS